MFMTFEQLYAMQVQMIEAMFEPYLQLMDAGVKMIVDGIR